MRMSAAWAATQPSLRTVTPEEQAAIDLYLAERGVTLCPVAACALTSATIPDEAKAAIAARFDPNSLEIDFAAEGQAIRARLIRWKKAVKGCRRWNARLARERASKRASKLGRTYAGA
jgi:hypothetical protein